MGQPTLSGLELNAGSGGAELLHDVVNSKIVQVVLMGFSTGDGTMNVVMSDAPLPVAGAVTNAGTFAVQATQAGTWTVVLGAGSAAIGKLAANSGVDIGDVDILSIAAGDNNIGNVDIVTLPAGNLGARAMAASLSTTLATDDTHFGTVGAASDVDGVIHGQLRYIGEALASVAVTGTFWQATQPVSGTFWQATQPVSGTFWQATQPISGAVTVSSGTITTVGTVSAITAFPADTFVAENGALGKGVLLQGDDGTDRHNLQTDANGYLKAVLQSNSGVDVGDVDVTSIAAGANVIGGVVLSSSHLYDGATLCEIKRVNVVTSTDGATLIAAVSGKKFRVISLVVSGLATTVTNVYLEDADGTDVYGSATGYFPVGVNADGDMIPGICLNENRGGWFQTPTANKNLVIKLSAAQVVVANLTYIEVT